ncbi:hypothetical protein DERP_013809 [Dermatophagoides pteronyssinus]|uniref:Uncharacterized protein n=1 Tax=Dermatophagoides pteronyssinus TaxID=6956 RepID=A0ABQ8JCM8_DERPT|nr:hypothetical protein DERP_013809 [Dermatophagoides pteronyssinus]
MNSSVILYIKFTYNLNILEISIINSIYENRVRELQLTDDDAAAFFSVAAVSSITSLRMEFELYCHYMYVYVIQYGHPF